MQGCVAVLVGGSQRRAAADERRNGAHVACSQGGVGQLVCPEELGRQVGAYMAIKGHGFVTESKGRPLTFCRGNVQGRGCLLVGRCGPRPGSQQGHDGGDVALGGSLQWGQWEFGFGSGAGELS